MRYRQIYTLLRRHLGLKLASLGNSTLERAVRQRLQALGLADADRYLDYLQHHPGELDALVEEVVVPETWFFRDRAYFDALAEVMLTEPFRSAMPLRVLSIPCSTGEECYSIAITLLSSGRSENDFRITGIDISRQALARARAARYGRRSFRNTEERFRSSYFHREDDTYRLVDRVRAMVDFRRGNIIDTAFMAGLGRFHIVFCKNILIYLCGWARHRALDHLVRILEPEGRLFAGTAEISLFLDHGFKAVSEKYPFLLAARPPKDRRQAAAPLQRPRRRRLHGGMIGPPPAPALLAERPDSISPIERARQLADRGELAAARRLLETEELPASAERYHLLGVIAKAAGDTDDAKKFLKKALYLDPHHADTLHLLAMLAENAGDLRAARSYRRRLQEIVTGA